MAAIRVLGGQASRALVPAAAYRMHRVWWAGRRWGLGVCDVCIQEMCGEAKVEQLPQNEQSSRGLPATGALVYSLVGTSPTVI